MCVSIWKTKKRCSKLTFMTLKNAIFAIIARSKKCKQPKNIEVMFVYKVQKILGKKWLTETL